MIGSKATHTDIEEELLVLLLDLTIVVASMAQKLSKVSKKRKGN